VAEELHFGRAAIALGLSQPQVSRHVAELERTLGVLLFVRTPRRTELTGAGSELLGDARETLAAADRLQRRARAVGRGGLGAVSVGFIWSTLGGYLAPLVAAAGERHREIELTVSQLRFTEVLIALRRGDVDLMITRALALESELVEVTLNREPSVLALPSGHPLVAESSIGVEQLHGEALVTLAPEVIPGAYEAGRRALIQTGISITGHRTATSPSEALALVSAGLGIYYRMPASAAIAQPGVVYRELEDVPMRTVLLRRPEPPSPAVSAIIDLSRALFSDAYGASHNVIVGLERAVAGT
jgi:DNA-binding transcriptional LysR family regulator